MTMTTYDYDYCLLRSFFLHYEKAADKCWCQYGKLHIFVQNIFQVLIVPFSCVPSFFDSPLFILTPPISFIKSKKN